ncbi:hypothetical protein V2J09_003108 [Rumex salicifolius]
MPNKNPNPKPSHSHLFSSAVTSQPGDAYHMFDKMTMASLHVFELSKESYDPSKPITSDDIHEVFENLAKKRRCDL